MRNVCLIDLDDVLGDFANPMIRALNAATGKNISRSDCTSFDVKPVFDISDKEFLDILINGGIIENTEIHESSYKFLSDLHVLNYYTVLITARGWHPNANALTEQWVADHALDIDELIVVDMHQSKADVVKKFSSITFSIDDRIKHCREYTQAGIIEHVLLYDAPWNTNLTSWNTDWDGHDYDERILDLHEIIDHVEWATNERRNGNVREVSK